MTHVSIIERDNTWTALFTIGELSFTADGPTPRETLATLADQLDHYVRSVLLAAEKELHGGHPAIAASVAASRIVTDSMPLSWHPESRRA